MAAQADQITVTVSLEVDDEVAVILVAVDVEEIHAFAGGVNAGPIFQRQPE